MRFPNTKFKILNTNLNKFPITRKLKIATIFFLIIFGSLTYLFTRPKTGDLCETRMQKLDATAIALPDDALPLKSFTAKDSDGQEFPINIEGQTVDSTLISLIDPDSPDRNLSYKIEVPENIELVSEGGYVAIKKDYQPLAMFRVPQAVDKNGYRIDYKYELEKLSVTSYKLQVVPARNWQLSCAKFPVDLHASITDVSWYEAIVKVGQNSDSPGATKDGDLIDIKPAGWNWGLAERKEYAIVKIPRLTQEEIEEYKTRTVTQPSDQEIEREQAEKYPDDYPLLADTPGLARYAIDYTKLATSEQLQAIRDPEVESPILSILDSPYPPDSPNYPLFKKTDPKISAIPEEVRLATKPISTDHPNFPNLVKDAHAAGTIIKSIGTSSRDYSTITLWETAQDGDLVTAQEIHKGEAYNDSVFNEAVRIDNSTTSSSYYMWLSVAEGEVHNGTAGTGAVYNRTGTLSTNDSTSLNFFWVSDPNTIIENFEITESLTDCSSCTQMRAIRLDDNSDGYVVRNTLIHDMDADPTNGIDYADDGYIYNNIGYNLRRAIAGALVGDGTMYAYNNTAYNNSQWGISVEAWNVGDTINMSNNLSVGSTTLDYNYFISSGTINASYDISSDNTADDQGGSGHITGAVIGNQFVSTTTGSINLHLKPGSDAVDAGTDLSSTFNDDIDNNPRPSGAGWDIGADEYTHGNPPVALWHFDEGYGSTANDSTDHDNDLTITNATWYVDPNSQAIQSTYLQFDGTGDYASRASDVNFNFGFDSFSLTGWFRHPSAISGQDTLIARYGTAGWKVYMDSSGFICFGIDGDGTWSPADDACTTISYADSKWHHFAAVKSSASSISLYIDAMQKDVDAALTASGSLNTSSTLYIGIDSDGSSNPWIGFIDEITIYNYALSSSQVDVDYNQGSARFGSLNPDPLTNGLVGYWKMDEASGNASDSSGNASTVTNQGTTTFSPAKFGKGAELNGTNQYFDAADNAALSVTGSLTLSAWINPDDTTGNQDIIGKFDQSNESYLLSMNGANLEMYIDSVSNYQATSGSPLSAAMTHVVGVYDSVTQTVKLYVNGVPQASSTTGTIPTSIGDDTGEFAIGAQDTGGTPANYFDGHIDDVRIYNRALSPVEVADLYNWAPGPAGWWKMDEMVSGDSKTLYDSSGNENNATTNDGANNTGINCSVTGKFGSGCGFDGTDDYVTVADSTDFLVDDSNNFSVMFWMYANTLGSDDLIYKRTGFTTMDWGVYYGGDLFVFLGESNADLIFNSDGITLSTKTWHHVAFTKEGTTYKLYVDGILKSTDTSSQTWNNSDNFTFGTDQPNETGDFDGKFDEIKIYNYARTPGQIVQDMNAGHPAPGSPVGSAVAHWKFDEGALNTCSGGSNDFCDASGNSNDLLFSTTTGGYSNSGKFGKAFNGTNAVWASRTDDSDFDVGITDDYTISLWYKADNAANPSTTEYLANKANATTAGYAVYANSSDQLCFGIDDDTSWGPDIASCTSADFYDTSWHHLVAVRDYTSSDKTYIYIDGVLRDSDSDSTTATLANSLSLYLADRDGTDNGDEFTGDLDKVKIYRLAMTADQVRTEYNSGHAQVWGATGTTSTGVASNSSTDSYCPPGQGTACTGPILEWLLDENANTTANDTSGNANSGTLTNSPTYSPGYKGSGLTLAGSNQHVTRADDPDLDFGASSAFTIQTWFKHGTASATETLVSKLESSGTDGGYKLKMESDGDITCETDDDDADTTIDDTATTTAANYDDGRWHHVACVYEVANTDLHIYIDGFLVASDTSTTTNSLANDDDFFYGIEAATGSEDWIGQLDNLIVYNYARTPAQIGWDINQGAPVGWWKLDESSWNGTAGEVKDSSGNALHGVRAGNATTTINGKVNNAGTFDGTGDEVDLGTYDKLICNQRTGFSVAAWYQWDTDPTADNDAVIGRWTGLSDRDWMITNDFGSIVFVIAIASDDSKSLYPLTQITQGQWQHVVGVWDPITDVQSIYINGKLEKTTTNVVTTCRADALNGTKIGNVPSAGRNIDGQIDEVKFWNYPLTAQQVRDVYNQGAVNFSP